MEFRTKSGQDTLVISDDMAKVTIKLHGNQSWTGRYVGPNMIVSNKNVRLQGRKDFMKRIFEEVAE